MKTMLMLAGLSLAGLAMVGCNHEGHHHDRAAAEPYPVYYPDGGSHRDRDWDRRDHDARPSGARMEPGRGERDRNWDSDRDHD